MRDLMITGRYRPVPPAFAAVWMAPGCVFYAHHTAVKQGVEVIERDLREGRRPPLPEGMTVVDMAIQQQAWALASCFIGGRG